MKNWKTTYFRRGGIKSAYRHKDRLSNQRRQKSIKRRRGFDYYRRQPLAHQGEQFYCQRQNQKEVNIDVLPHLTCRDKNISHQSYALGLNIEGVQNIVCGPGDPLSRPAAA